MILQVDHDGAPVRRAFVDDGRGAFGHVGGAAGERDDHGVGGLGGIGGGDVKDGNAIIVDDGLLRRRRTALQQRNAEQQGWEHGNRLSVSEERG